MSDVSTDIIHDIEKWLKRGNRSQLQFRTNPSRSEIIDTVPITVKAIKPSFPYVDVAHAAL